MNPDEMQNQMTPEDASSSLAFSTNLMEQAMASQTKDQKMSQEQGGNIENGQPEPSEGEDLKGEFSAFREEITQTIKEEIGGIKKMVEDAMNEEEPESSEEPKKEDEQE